MSNAARRALYHRIRHMADDRVVRIVGIVAALMGVLMLAVFRPAPVYLLDGSRCKKFSTYTVICPTNEAVRK